MSPPCVDASVDGRPQVGWSSRPVTLTALAMLATAPTLVAFIAGFGWPYELASHFHTQYLLALLPMTALCALRRRPVIATIVGVAAIYNVTLLAPYYLPAPTVPADGTELRVLLTNVNTTNRPADRLIELVRQERPDILAMIEVDRVWLDALSVLHDEYPHRTALPRTDNFGIALFSRRPGTLEIVTLGDLGLPSIRAALQVGDRTVTFLVTHPPPPMRDTTEARDQQLRAVGDMIAKLPDPVALLGDLNATPWSPIFTDLLDRTRLRDARLGFGVCATWPSPLGPFGIPIDHVLIRGAITVADLRVGATIGSDHRPLIVDLVVN